MGSSGMKKNRKGGKRQHLDKVDHHAHDAAAREQQRERQAVLDTMGMGGAGRAGRVIVWTVFALLAILAVGALLVLTVF